MLTVTYGHHTCRSIMFNDYLKYYADNHIKAKSFIHDLTESDIDGEEFGKFTIIGRRVLKRLLRQVYI